MQSEFAAHRSRRIGAHKGASLALLAAPPSTRRLRASLAPRARGRSALKRPGYAKQRSVKQRYLKHSKRSRIFSRPERAAWRRRVARRKSWRHAGRSGRIPVRAYPIQALPIGSDIVGAASCYWQSQKTATGAWFNPEGMTAAHLTLPFGTRVRVTHMGNGRSVEVLINDRGRASRV